MPGILLSLLGTVGLSATALQAQIDVVDINQTPGLTDIDSNPRGFTSHGNEVFFSAHDSLHGRELWVTTDVPGTARRLGDIDPGPAGADPEEITAVGTSIYFTATRIGEGRELWKVGIRGVPQLVADILPRSLSSSPRELTAVGTDLWFSAQSLAGDRELYRLDTTTDTLTRMDIRPGLLGSDPRSIVPFRRGIVCTADDGVHGRELWYATSSTGASLFADIQPGAVGSSPDEIVVTSSTVYCAATTTAGGREVWRKGLVGAPDRPFDLWPGAGSSNPRGLVIDDATAFRLYFFADDGRGRRELWEYQPTLNPLPMRRFYTLGNNRVLAAAERAFVLATPSERWVVFQVRNTGGSDHLLFLSPGRASADAVGPFDDLRDLVVAPGRIYFRQAYGAGRDQVRTFASPTDTSTTTGEAARRISGLGLGPNGSYLLLGAEGHDSDGVELHRIRGGSGQSIDLLDELNQGLGTKDSNPVALTALPEDSGRADSVVFVAETGGTLPNSTTPRVAVHVSDGTVSGTVELFGGDGLISAAPRSLVAYGDAVWFTAVTGAEGRELYRTRGTAASTRLVADVVPGFVGSRPSFLTGFAGRMFFSPELTNQLWASDGTTAGTAQVDAIPAASEILGMAALDDRLLLLVEVGGSTELWSTDGTPGAASQVGTLFAGVFRPCCVRRLGDRVVWWDRFGIFATDGTRVGSVQLPVTLGSDLAQSFAVQGRTLYMIGDPPFSGRIPSGGELWATDGTVAGTRLVKDLAVGSANALEYGATLVAADDAVYFTADDGTGRGRELYKALGPIATAVLRVTDLDNGAGDGVDGPLGAVGTSQQVAFSGGLEPSGSPDRELWIADGRGVSRLVDLNPGAAGSEPAGFVTSGNRLFFAANDGVAGRELCSMPLAVIEAPNVVRYGSACAAAGQPEPRLSAVTNPRYGQTLQLRTEGGVAGQAAFVLLGLFPIEVPLGNGCALRNTGELAFGGASDGTFADVSLPLPNIPSLAGISLYAQMARIAPGGPALGVGDLSDGLRLVVGQR